ncbi:Pif1 DNA helicase [Carabus blaptoides fortunei]
MDSSDSSLTCTINIEWLNTHGTILRKVTHKSGTLRMIRNGFREMFIEVSATKAAPVKLLLKSINVHKKFMAEGKASIVFQDERCNLYLSNAPPGSLLSFLRTMFVKMTGEKNEQKPETSLRTQLLSNKPAAFEEISPVTVADLHKAKEKIPRTTDTTPSPGSRKRKLSERRQQGPAAKKLHCASPIPDEVLNSEQQDVLSACLAGHNVFFTGSAGTGKSYLLKKIISVLPPAVTVATASTGVAACHIGGITLHAFAGVGNGDATLERCFQLASKPQCSQIWRRTRHLIIDEISMVDGTFFGKIEAVASSKSSSQKEIKFCFQSPAWEQCIKFSYELQVVHRQTDPEFIAILNNIRIGRVTSEISAKLNRTAKQQIEQAGVLATRLCSQNADADIINETKLKSLTGEVKTFLAQDTDAAYTRQLDQQTPVSCRVILKVGAQVMLLKNVSVSKGLVNGARGIVVRFENDLPVVRFRNNREHVARQEKWAVRMASGTVITRFQVPLKLAWAFSIHKSQGLTLDCVEMSLAGVFEPGQAYVALSRAQSLQTLRVLDFSQKHVWANPDVLKFYKNMRRKMDQTAIVPLGKKLPKPLMRIK